MTWDGTTLTSPNGGTIALNEKAKKAFEEATKQGARRPKVGDRADTPLDGGADPGTTAGTPAPLQIWYADPAEHANAYIAVTFEDGGVLVRDGMDKTGAVLQFSYEQWEALTDPDGDGLGEPEGDAKHPAAVRNPDDLYKVDPKRADRNR